MRISDWSSDVCSSDLLEEWTADDGSFADRLSAILGIDAVTTRQLLGNRHTHGQETTRYVHYDRFRKRFPAAGRIMARLPGGIRVLGGGFLKGGDRQRAEFPPGWPEKIGRAHV